jgi:orotate phosphoribosyltransferase
MNQIEFSRTISRNLLQIQAIKFNFEEAYTWASGWKSPVYCDNRKSLSYSAVRTMIRDAYVKVIQANFPDVEVVAGVATGAIAQGALVADQLNLPFIYVREKPKDHGLKRIIEGVLDPEQKVVIVEDLVSTGGSSLKVADELRKENADVLGMVAIFSYEFPVAIEKFKEKNCKLFTLTTFSALQDVALEDGYITAEDVNQLCEWRKNPQIYKK